MIKEKYIITKWNSKTKKYYENLGYIFTKMGDDLNIFIEHLPKRSQKLILIECDYCHMDYMVRWCHRTKSFEDCSILKDACINCRHKKAQESLQTKYGITNVMQVKEFYDKQRKSCLDSLGFENPFQSDIIKEKIYATNYKKYGKKSYTQTKEYLEKKKKTCLEKYGYEDFMQHPKYKQMFVGSKSPVWKGGKNDCRWERMCDAYKEWKFFIFKKNDFKCKKCGIHSKDLQAHHIYNWKSYPDKRYDIENGICLCSQCHKMFHNIFGKKNNNPEQLKLFLQEK